MQGLVITLIAKKRNTSIFNCEFATTANFRPGLAARTLGPSGTAHIMAGLRRSEGHRRTAQDGAGHEDFRREGFVAAMSLLSVL